MFDRYGVKLVLTRDMLGTNPCDPAVLDTHIIERQRKLIEEKSGLNAKVNKYLDALQITPERKEEEVELIYAKLEELLGTELTSDQRKLVAAGKLAELRETFAGLELTGTTVFFWDKEKNRPCIGDHMIYGFLKAAAEAIGRTRERKNGEIFGSVSYTQSIINQHVRCGARFLTFDKDIKRDAAGDPLYLQRSLRAKTAQGPRISLARSEVVPEGARLSFELRVMKGSPLAEKHLREMFDYGQMTGLGQWRNSGCGMFTYELMKQPA